MLRNGEQTTSNGDIALGIKFCVSCAPRDQGSSLTPGSTVPFHTISIHFLTFLLFTPLSCTFFKETSRVQWDVHEMFHLNLVTLKRHHMLSHMLSPPAITVNWCQVCISNNNPVSELPGGSATGTCLAASVWQHRCWEPLNKALHVGGHTFTYFYHLLPSLIILI